MSGNQENIYSDYHILYELFLDFMGMYSALNATSFIFFAVNILAI